jgi:predicted MPP superfamily phosphohydrolase
MGKNKNYYKLRLRWKILILFILLVISTFLWSYFIGTKGLEIKEYKVANNKIPASFYGLKVVHFSDLHYGRTIKEKELINHVNEINLTKPDIVIFTGDLIDRDIKATESIKELVIKHLKDINSTYGNYFVTGNHDRSLKDYVNIMEESNFKNINNNYDIIYGKDYENIFIGGMSSYITSTPNIKNVEQYFKENKEIPKYKIFVMHIPDDIKYIKDYNFDLVLSGHSHNGQVRFPYMGAIIKPLGAKKYYNEYYKIENTDFYISSGIGTSTLNIRLFDKPSFNLYRLVNK